MLCIAPRLKNLFAALVFLAALLVGLDVAQAQPTPTPAQSPSPAAAPTPDPAVAKVDAVKAALNEATVIIASADEVRLDARSRGARLSEKCKLPTATEQTMIEFDEVSTQTIEVAQRKVLTSITEAEAKITAVETKLKAAKDALPTGEPVHPDVKKAKADAEARGGDLDQQRKALTTAKTEVTSALQRAFTCAEGLVSSMSGKIAPLKTLAADAKGDAVLTVMNRSLPDLSSVIRFKQRLATVWGANQSTGGLIRALSAGGKTDAELKTVTDGLGTIDNDVKSIGEKLKTWLASVSAFVKTKRSKLADVTQQVVVDPQMFSGPGESEAKAGTRASASLSQLTALLGIVEAQFSDIVSALDAQAISDSGTELVEETRRLGVAVTLLQDSLGGFEDFEADQVSLFYFTDVRRLMQTLNSSTFEVGGLADARERASQARKDLGEAELTLAEAQGQVNTQQRRLTELQEEQRQAHAQFLSADDLLTTSKRKLDELKARPDKNERKIQLAEQRQTDLQGERDAAKERDDQLRSEQDGLPAQIRQAQSDLASAQERVRTSRTNIIRLAITESEAFARARDNRPFLVAMPIAASPDPVKRVMMFAFDDSKTIFLRGKREHLDKVTDIIARFDRPAPQARMTLWSLEMNSTADKSGSSNFNEALETIERELANTRARISTSLSFLRSAINNQVNAVAYAQLKGVKEDSDLLRCARLHFYQREVLMRLGFPPGHSCTDKLPLGVANFTLPDPAATTTLGEALMVLSLASQESQRKIITNFRENLKAQIDSLQLQEPPVRIRSDSTNDPHLLNNSLPRFAFMRKAMGLDQFSGADTDSTPAQQEIVRAIQAGSVSRVIEAYKIEACELDHIDKELQKQLGAEDRAALEARREFLVDQLLAIEAWVESQFGRRLRTGKEPLSAKVRGVVLENLQAAGRQLNPLRKASARVAAADQMLKEMIIAVEDDLDRHFIQPMMHRLREGLVKQYKGVGVGIIQRTSVLATNRGLARVDARGSAQLAVGDETDILEGIQQLANLYLAGQTGNALSILGGLNALPRKDKSELYGLTTGGVFKVTPIFDPSGQALRFQFDHVAATMVREPDGTTNPQLPRVERHTVNTEVQLSNMELREVSRFNANARLGLPKRTWGGLPIFNSVPWIRRNLPLIGWFVKKEGDAPFVQQSLIFGQTTMYPTIGDIMDLLRTPTAPERTEKDECPKQ